MSEKMKKTLVLAGGGHAHIHTIYNLEKITSKGHEVILVSPSEYHYYSGMGPGMIGGIYRPDEIRFNIRNMAETRGAKFIRDSVVKINPEKKTLSLGSGRITGYDAVSFNIGSIVSFNTANEDKKNIYTVRPIENLWKAKNRISGLCRNRKISVALIGGGPAAVEVACNIHSLAKMDRLIFPETRIYCDRFMPGNMKYAGHAEKILSGKGIIIFKGMTATGAENGIIKFSTGQTAEADIILVASGVTSQSVFRDSMIHTGADGCMSVNSFLQSVDFPDIFGGGDCIHFTDHPLDKAGVYAVRQADVLFRNLCAYLDEKPLVKFNEWQKNYLRILNTGQGKGLLEKNGIVVEGKTAFMIKDFIDRRFMRKFRSGTIHED